MDANIMDLFFLTIIHNDICWDITKITVKKNY